MQRKIQITSDGSHTVVIPGMGVSYHSHHGAIAESIHVYIDAGFRAQPGVTRDVTHPENRPPVRILEIGFGTGLNALLTLREAIQQQAVVEYVSVEPYPLTAEEYLQLNHGEQTGLQNEFLLLHTSPWNRKIQFNPFFSLEKKQQSIHDPAALPLVNCIYFDAFAPGDQPDMWTQAVFEKMFGCLETGGTLVTYCSKSAVRRTMQAAGFRVEKLQGPHGKRDMVRAHRD